MEVFTAEMLSGIEIIVAHLFFPLSLFIFLTIAISFLLLILLTVLRKKSLAIAGLWLIHLIPWLVDAIYGSWLPLVGGVLVGTLLTIAVARFGLLALYSYFLFAALSFNHTITSDFSSWYAKNTLFVFVVIMSLAIYGFYTSLAGQPLLKGKLLKD